jgi:hypothetical protein
MSTLFQDSAGTTPVTAVEQPVGRMLDKSGRGNHASQAAAASRPVLSARVNMLTKTEDFSDSSAWVKSPSSGSTFQGTGRQAVVTPNYGMAPNGTQTADRVQLNLNGGTSISDRSGFYASPGNLPVGIETKSVLYVKPLDGTTAEQILASNLAVAAYGGTTVNQQVEMLQDGWMMITRVHQVGVTSGDWRLQIFGGSGRPDSMDLLVWGADFGFKNDRVGLPVYQRVNTANDYDTAGFPLYLRCDGADDGMQTDSIDFTATDAMTVWAGVRKLSDAARGMLIELGEGTVGGGRFNVSAPAANSATYSVFNAGSVGAGPIVSVTPYPSPESCVLTFIGKISQPKTNFRRNSSSIIDDATTLGTGTYGNYPIYLFRRGGTTLPFNGRFYGLIIRGAQSSGAQIAAVERWMNNKTRAY